MQTDPKADREAYRETYRQADIHTEWRVDRPTSSPCMPTRRLKFATPTLIHKHMHA